MSTKQVTTVGLGAALMAVFSQISIPIPNVPLTFQLFGVVLLGIILPKKLSTLSLCVFVLLGAVGVPVFAGFKGGLSILVGATGGYLYSFVLAVYIVGAFSAKKNIICTIFGAYLGIGASYILGTIQLKYVVGMSWAAAISAGTGAGVFLIKDIILVGVAIIVGRKIQTILKQSGIFDKELLA